MISEKTGNPIRLRQTGLGDLVSFEAEDCFGKSAEIFAEANIDGERARTLREWARYELRRDNREFGTQLWNEARTIFERLGATHEVERMSELPS